MNEAILAIIGYICVSWVIIGAITLIAIWPLLRVSGKMSDAEEKRLAGK